MNKKIRSLSIFLTSTFPVFSFAAVTDFRSLVSLLIDLVRMVIPLIVALALLYFMIGVFQLVRSNSDDARKSAVATITYGIISLFVMVSVWGLVQILTSTFFGGGSIIIPSLGR